MVRNFVTKIKHHFGLLSFQLSIRIGSVSVLGLLYTVSIGFILSGGVCSFDLVRCHSPCSLQLEMMSVKRILVPVITLQQLEGTLTALARLLKYWKYAVVAGRSK